MDTLDQFWAQILSGDPEQIRLAWDCLAADERVHLLRHLERMRSEEGWHASQRESAVAALQTIDKLETPS